MKIYFLECKADYSKYHFPYRVYLKKEASDGIDKIYESGFLPSRSKLDLYYLARSVRVDLDKFKESSENRRISKKTGYMSLDVVSLDGFKYDYTIGKMGKDFYDKRFGKNVMSVNKIKWLFTEGFPTHVAVYKDNAKVLGYCLLVKGENFVHYAYPFYDLNYFKRNAGIGMMLKLIQWAKKNELRYVYLGTCYSESALYKIQFKGCEYFTGWNWSSDLNELKNLARNNMTQKISDDIFKNWGIKI